MIQLSGWEHSQGKTQYIPVKQVLVLMVSWLWKNLSKFIILPHCVMHSSVQCSGAHVDGAEWQMGHFLIWNSTFVNKLLHATKSRLLYMTLLPTYYNCTIPCQNQDYQNYQQSQHDNYVVLSQTHIKISRTVSNIHNGQNAWLRINKKH